MSLSSINTRKFALLLSLCAMALSACSEGDPPAASAVPCPEETCLSTGQFYVDVDLSGSGTIRVRHASAPDRIMWSTSGHTPVLKADNSTQEVTESRGSFTFDLERESSCHDSRLDAMEATEDGLLISGHFEDCALTFTLSFRAVANRRLQMVADVKSPEGQAEPTEVSIGWASDEKEGFFGFGAQYNYLNLKGRLLPIWCQEQGHGRGLEPLSELLNAASPGSAGTWYSSYTCVPYTLSTNGYGFIVENTEYVEFDMRENAFTRATAFSHTLTTQLIAGDSPLDIVETYTEYSGRMEPLPEWTQQGAIVRSYGGSEAALSKVTELDLAGGALAALWIEDWAGTRETPFGTRMWWNWDIDRTVYPDFEDMVAELNTLGVRSLIYFNPFLTDASEKPGLERHLFEEAEEAGYLVHNKEGETELVPNGGFDAAMLDLTNADTRSWIKEVMRNLIDKGVSGWMADFGEALPLEIALASGVEPETYHNQYPFDWAELNKEVAAEAGVTSEHLTFNRSGNARSPSVARSFWIGDQLVTWDDFDGIKTVIPALLSSGLSGYTLQHADVGGWLSVNQPLVEIELFRTKELFQRWMEINSFTVLVRLHTTNLPELNHQYNTDEETLVHFSRLSQVFASLAPYRKTLMDEAASRGIPVVRHPMLHYPQDTKVYELKQQFMLGADFMVAPVLDEGVTTVSVYLPAGSWTHLWSGKEMGNLEQGETLTVDAPIGEPAVFYRSNSEWGPALRESLIEKGIL
jgi:alpha-glucosidase (family GH31 glycosyl hydrolase)